MIKKVEQDRQKCLFASVTMFKLYVSGPMEPSGPGGPRGPRGPEGLKGSEGQGLPISGREKNKIFFLKFP